MMCGLLNHPPCIHSRYGFKCGQLLQNILLSCGFCSFSSSLNCPQAQAPSVSACNIEKLGGSGDEAKASAHSQLQVSTHVGQIASYTSMGTDMGHYGSFDLFNVLFIKLIKE